MTDQRQLDAQRRMETRMAPTLTYEGQINDDPNPRAEYPRMLYRATDREQTQEWADSIATLKDPPMVINRFDGMLCDTIIAHSADEADELASDGWDISPRAAHGLVDGLVAASTAKDARIAELEAALRDRSINAPDQVDAPRRPGRPRKAEPVE